jgi:hypothetical protein
MNDDEGLFHITRSTRGASALGIPQRLGLVRFFVVQGAKLQMSSAVVSIAGTWQDKRQHNNSRSLAWPVDS